MSKTLTFLGACVVSALGGAVITHKSKGVRNALDKVEEATDKVGQRAKMTVENLRAGDKNGKKE